MRPIIVLGNGESRKDIKLLPLKDHYTLIGCNAIHRDIEVDHLVCCDQRMVKEALLTFPNIIYTRSKYLTRNKNVKEVPPVPYLGNQKPDDPEHWGSGPYAVLLATYKGSSITLLGFDLYDVNFQVNNLYKGTANYASANSHPVDPCYWVYQLAKIFESFPNKRFNIINKDEWPLPAEWNLPNVYFFTINFFQQTCILSK